MKKLTPSVAKQGIQRNYKESVLKQHSKALWFTGLPCSGKTTLALALEKKLFDLGFFVQILDGDIIRSGINNNLGFSISDRTENIRRIAEVTKLFVESGIITINCFVSPTQQIRTLAKTIIGENNFIEVFINAPLEICEKRDVKGMYKQARSGKIKHFTGIDDLYEPPINPHIVINTAQYSVDDCCNKIIEYILPIIEY